jgi:hypothetical protein
MSRCIYIFFFVLVCIFSCVTVSVVFSPVHASGPIVSNARETDQTASRDARDESVKGKQQQEFIATKGLEYVTTKKDPKPKGAAFIRLKPKFEDDDVDGPRKVFDVEFMNDETSGQKTKKDSNGGPYMKFEKIDDPEKNSILVRKATEKDYKTELSMGLRVSPYSEIYLGKGFLVDRKDDFSLDPRDNGWRLKFKFDF